MFNFLKVEEESFHARRSLAAAVIVIVLIERAGGAFAYGEWVATKVKSRKSSLIWTWLLGIVVFIILGIIPIFEPMKKAEKWNSVKYT